MLMQMKPTELFTFLVSAITERLAVLITGAPGIGKSDIVAQAAIKAGARTITSHPAVADPTDVKGLPWPSANKKSATFLPFGELFDAMHATELVAWFLDDLGQASQAVQASFMQLLLARRVNGHVLPDCVTFVAATNLRTDRAGVMGILEPVKSRFVTIVELVPDLDDWCQYMLHRDDMPPEVIAFLRFRPELLCDFKATADLTNSPLPRTWAHVGRILKQMQLPSRVESAAIAGAVGEGAASEFLAFLRMYRELPNIDGILVDPDAAVLPDKPNILYAVTTGLATKANEQTFARIARYADRLVGAGHGEFAALLLRDCVRRAPDVQQTTTFVELATGELGQLISGQVD